MQDLTLLSQPAASMWFLADLYRCTNQAKYLEGAKKIASFLMKEIIPEQKWIDLEPYFSCGQNPLTFLHDDEQRLLVRGNLSAIWAAEGFASLFRATSDKQYSDAGERVVDYLAFSQACFL